MEHYEEHCKTDYFSEYLGENNMLEKTLSF